MREWCAPEAYWRSSENVCYGQEPPCEKLSVHSPRQRSEQDKDFSDFEDDLHSLPLASLERVLFEEWEFFEEWERDWEINEWRDIREAPPVKYSSAM